MSNTVVPGDVQDDGLVQIVRGGLVRGLVSNPPVDTINPLLALQIRNVEAVVGCRVELQPYQSSMDNGFVPTTFLIVYYHITWLAVRFVP